MHRSVVFLVLLSLLAPQALAADHTSVAQWLAVEPATSATFSKTFAIEGDIQQARLRAGTSAVDVVITLDGKPLQSVRAYDPLLDEDVVLQGGSGRHTLEVAAKSQPGPSAFFVQLDVTRADGSRSAVVSDASWNRSAGKVMTLGAVERKLLVPTSRRARIRPIDNYEQWRLADGDKASDYPVQFDLLPGFKIERLRQATEDEDSWISLTFDPLGRLLIGKEKQGILRLTFRTGSHTVINTEHLADSLKECRGLTFIGDTLYVNANESRGLYRLKVDPETDGFLKPELVLSTAGGTGHGRNDLTSHRDGKLYSIHGDAVDLLQKSDIESAFQDWTSPVRRMEQADSAVASGREGHLLRVDPNSGAVDLLSAGLRNPFGIDFNAAGEAFTYDADAEFDMGSPWYRPTRVVHLVAGSDVGWRGVTGQWPPYYPDHPDNAVPGIDIGKGSPTAVKFADASHFPAPFNDALLILDWAYGRVIAVHQVPRGSSYLMTAEVFLQGRPLNVTDLDFASDGSLYLITGGRQTQSALYRVWWDEESDKNDQKQVASPFQIERAELAADARSQRQELERALTQPASNENLQAAWRYLDHPDTWIRHAAARLLERQSFAAVRQRALTESSEGKAIPALLTVMRSSEGSAAAEVIERLNEMIDGVETPTNRIAALYTYWLALQSRDVISDKMKAATANRLSEYYPSRSLPPHARSENLWLSRVLTELQADKVVDKTMRLLREATDQREQMHYLFTLRHVEEGWSQPLWLNYFAALKQAEQYLSGAGMPGFLEKIREEALASVAAEYRGDVDAFLKASQNPLITIQTTDREPVQTWKPDDFASVIAGVDQQQPTETKLRNGRRVFREAACVNCHRFGTEGTLVGPDLTQVGRRFNASDLLSSILQPSKVIAENYRSLQVLTVDGKTFTGQATSSGDYRTPQLRLAVDPLRPLEVIEIPKSDIDAQKYSDVSWMPAGLVDTFTQQEILDLISLLRSGPVRLEASVE